MAFTRKTWLWILAAVLGFGVLCVIALAGFGMYFVSKHTKFQQATSAQAAQAFEEARAPFKDEQPIYDIDDREHPRQIRDLATMPSSSTPVDMVWVLVWDSDKEQLAQISLPFWLLRWGRQKIDLKSGGHLQLDVRELQRVGPVVLVDYRPPSGDRVFVWTK